MQFLDLIFDLAALAGAFRRSTAALLQVGNHKARVVFGLIAVCRHDLGFDEDAALLLPGSGRVVGFPEDVLSHTAAPREFADSPHSPVGLALQHSVLGHRHHILDPGLGIQKDQQLRMREAGIETTAKGFKIMNKAG
jgi:hypothetical protein